MATRLRFSRGPLYALKALQRRDDVATRRRGDAVTLNLVIFDRTRICKYAFDRIISIRETNLLHDSEIIINISFAYHLTSCDAIRLGADPSRVRRSL